MDKLDVQAFMDEPIIDMDGVYRGLANTPVEHPIPESAASLPVDMAMVYQGLEKRCHDAQSGVT